MIVFGLNTFGDVTRGADGRLQAMDVVLREVVEQAEYADSLGVDAFGVGEHHRDDFAISAPEVVLATIAGRTKRIKLSSAVTVLSTDDPVRVFQRFSTLHALSKGRAEPILGRGSFTESYPLFGFDLADYDLLFEERLELFAKILREKEVTWQGQTRPALTQARIYPPLSQDMPVWVGVGGSPQSVVRVARHGLRLALAIIGGDPLRFRPYVDLYHRAVEHFGGKPQPIAVHSPGFVGQTDTEAMEALWPNYLASFGRIGRERGWPPPSKESFMAECRAGALVVGSPETVARKIVRLVKGLRIQRFDLKYATGPMPHPALLSCIQLYAERVVPLVREMLAETAPA